MVLVAQEGRFGPYVVHECVGTGGMATVHRATITLEGNVEREVALKRLLPHLADEEQFLDDFVREAKLAANLRHPNIVRVFELGKIGETYFIAMELVRGASVGSMIKKSTSDEKRPSLGAVVSLMLELTDALDHAHNGTDDHGAPLHLVHRDLTPSNLLVTDDGHLKVIDFGVAKAMSGDLSTNSGNAKGKIGYMSPEAIAAQEVDARTDIFSAGVVMWELLTGRRLFKPVHDWDTTVHDKPVEPPSKYNRDCTPELDGIVLRCLAMERADRWPSAEALHRELTRLARAFAGTTTPKAVVRWKRTLRVESNFEPYATIVVEEQSRPGARGGKARAPRAGSMLRAVSPNVVPRALTPNIVARARLDAPTVPGVVKSWPPEPTTSPLIRIEVDPDPDTAPVPDTLIPNDFDAEEAEPTEEGPSAIRRSMTAQATQEAPVVGRRHTKRKLKPPPIPPPKRKGAPLRPPNPSPAADRIPRRTPLDTEPSPTVGRGPVDTERSPTLGSKPRGRGKPG